MGPKCKGGASKSATFDLRVHTVFRATKIPKRKLKKKREGEPRDPGHKGTQTREKLEKGEGGAVLLFIKPGHGSEGAWRLVGIKQTEGKKRTRCRP